MPKNRVIPFGYCMKNGKIIADLAESKAVVKIFEEYLNGSGFQQIARLMESKKIRYTADSDHWNKNMVKRIIENEKYLGMDKWVCGQKVGHQNLMYPGSFARRNKDCIL